VFIVFNSILSFGILAIPHIQHIVLIFHALDGDTFFQRYLPVSPPNSSFYAIFFKSFWPRLNLSRAHLKLCFVFETKSGICEGGKGWLICFYLALLTCIGSVRLKMNEHGNEERVFEMGVVIPKRVIQEEDESCDCAHVLVKEFENVGFEVERVIGIADEFIKVRFSQFHSMFHSCQSLSFNAILYSSCVGFFLFGMPKGIPFVCFFHHCCSLISSLCLI